MDHNNNHSNFGYRFFGLHFSPEPPEPLRVCRNPEFTEFIETLGVFFASQDCPEPVGTVATPPLDDEQWSHGGRDRTCRLVLSQEPTEVGSAESPPPFLSRANSFISGGLQLENLRGELYQSWQVCEWADEGEMKHQLDPQEFCEIYYTSSIKGRHFFKFSKMPC